MWKWLTFIHILGVAESEGNGETAKKEDSCSDAPNHQTLSAVAVTGAVGVDPGDCGELVVGELSLFITININFNKVSWKFL